MGSFGPSNTTLRASNDAENLKRADLTQEDIKKAFGGGNDEEDSEVLKTNSNNDEKNEGSDLWFLFDLRAVC